MGPETQISLTIGGALAILGLVWRVATRVERARNKQEDHEEEIRQIKQELREFKNQFFTVWTALSRRGLMRAKMTGLIDTNAAGTMRVSEHARELFTQTGLAGELRAWWRRTWREKGPDFDTDSALLEIETHWGERITNEVCGPLGIYDLECLQIALIIAREDHTRR